MTLRNRCTRIYTGIFVATRLIKALCQDEHLSRTSHAIAGQRTFCGGSGGGDDVVSTLTCASHVSTSSPIRAMRRSNSGVSDRIVDTFACELCTHGVQSHCQRRSAASLRCRAQTCVRQRRGRRSLRISSSQPPCMRLDARFRSLRVTADARSLPAPVILHGLDGGTQQCSRRHLRCVRTLAVVGPLTLLYLKVTCGSQCLRLWLPGPARGCLFLHLRKASV